MQNPYAALLDLPGQLAPARTVAMLAPMTFLENLDIDDAGEIVMTSLLDGRLWRVPFGGKPEVLAQITGRPSSVARAPDGGWLVFGWTLDGRVAAFHVRFDGKWEEFLHLPDAIFPNGAQRLAGGIYLLADSVTATIWRIDFHARSVSAWLQHPLLGPGPGPGSWAPALNGMKIWGDRLYMSNSSTSQLLALAIRDGAPVGEPELFRDGLSADDFAIDRDGTLYLTTHPMDVVLKLTQAGQLSRIAGPDDGVRGCTACRFGRRPGDETGLYVITDGGLFNPLSGGLQPARVVRLETGVPGAPVDPDDQPA